MKRVWSIVAAIIKGVVEYLFANSPPSCNFMTTPTSTTFTPKAGTNCTVKTHQE